MARPLLHAMAPRRQSLVHQGSSCLLLLDQAVAAAFSHPVLDAASTAQAGLRSTSGSLSCAPQQ